VVSFALILIVGDEYLNWDSKPNIIRFLQSFLLVLQCGCNNLLAIQVRKYNRQTKSRVEQSPGRNKSKELELALIKFKNNKREENYNAYTKTHDINILTIIKFDFYYRFIVIFKTRTFKCSLDAAIRYDDICRRWRNK